MKQSTSERRMAENQVVFRRYNERVQRGFDEVRRIADEVGEGHLIQDDNTPVYFYCECSDETCRKRIKMLPDAFNQIHTKRNRFVILRGHEVSSIEKVVATRGDYCIVEKFKTPRENVESLHQTMVRNES